MHHIDFHSKRTQLALRFFTYGVMTVSVVVISALVLLFALGYRFDNTSLSFEQGGLMQFRSTPSAATIRLNDKQLNFRTPGKATVAAGKYDVAMNLNGYHSWSKTVDIERGQLLWLNYARFIPQNITTTSVREFDTLNGSLTSPNRRWIALQPTATDPNFIIADIRNQETPAFNEVSLPAASYTQRDAQPHTFEMVEWDLSGRYLLIRHTVADVEEFIRFDRENPAVAVNLSAVYGPITRAQFAGNNGNVLYAIINNELRRVQVGNNETALLVSGATYFVVYRGDRLAFIADRNDRREVGMYRDDRETLVADFALDTAVTVSLSAYFNKDYVAIGTGNTVTVYQDPDETHNRPVAPFETFTIDQPSVEWLYFSNNGRFIVAQHQGSFTTYDLELADIHKRTFESSQPVTRAFKWLDDYYLWVDLDNSVRIVEFDGANERTITSAVTGQTVSLSDDGESLFSIGRNNADQKLVLQRSQLVLK